MDRFDDDGNASVCSEPELAPMPQPPREEPRSKKRSAPAYDEYPTLKGPARFCSNKYKAAAMADERREAILVCNEFSATRGWAWDAMDAPVFSVPSNWCYPRDPADFEEGEERRPGWNMPGLSGDYERQLDNFEPGYQRQTNRHTNLMSVGQTSFAWVILLQNDYKGFAGFCDETRYGDDAFKEHCKLIATHAVGKKKAKLAAGLTPAQIKRYEELYKAIKLGVLVGRGVDFHDRAKGYLKTDACVHMNFQQTVRDATLKTMQDHKALLPAKLHTLLCTPDEKPFLLARFCMLVYVHFEEDYPKAVRTYRQACRLHRFYFKWFVSIASAKDPAIFDLREEELTPVDEMPASLARLHKAQQFMDGFLMAREAEREDKEDAWLVPVKMIDDKPVEEYRKRANRGARQVALEAAAHRRRSA